MCSLDCFLMFHAVSLTSVLFLKAKWKEAAQNPLNPIRVSAERNWESVQTACCLHILHPPLGMRQLGHNIINDRLCRFGSTMSVMQRCHDLTRSLSISLNSGSEAFESPKPPVNNESVESVQKANGSCASSSIER